MNMQYILSGRSVVQKLGLVKRSLLDPFLGTHLTQQMFGVRYGTRRGNLFYCTQVGLSKKVYLFRKLLSRPK